MEPQPGGHAFGYDSGRPVPPRTKLVMQLYRVVGR
jgi:hypothetical protein